MSNPRQSGIEVLGDMPWGSHFCLFYETKQDLLDTLVPYFKAGLESNEFSIWVISNPSFITAEEAKAALEQAVPGLDKLLAEGRIEIFNALDWYLEENELNIERILKAWDAKLKRALAQGYDGIRISGDTFWLGQRHLRDFYAYEKQLHDFITDLPMTVLCTYSLAKFGAAEILDVVQTHQFAIIRRQGEWDVVETPELIQAKVEIKRLKEELQRSKEQTSRPFVILNYLAAVLSVTAALILAKILGAHLATAPISLFLCAIMFSAWYGGVKPGLLAMALSLLAFRFYFVDPIYSWAIDIREVPRLLIFALSSIFILLLVAAQRSATESLRRAHDVLDVTVRKLRQTNGALRMEIIERKHAETLLQAKGQEFRAIVEHTPDQIIRYDRELRPTYINPAVVKAGSLLTGILTGKAIGADVRDATTEIEEGELAQIRQRINAVFTTGRSYEYEIVLPSSTVPKYYNVRLCPEFDLNSAVINVLCIARDITQRKQAEDELRLAYQRLSYHVENTPLAVIEFDKDLYIKRWSARAEEIFGWKASEALGKNVNDPDFPIVYEEDLKAVDKINTQLMKGIVNRNLSLNRNYTKDGDVIYCEWHNSVLRTEHGNVITILSLVHDVTERKKTEETLNRSYDEIRQLTNHLQKIREEERAHIAREIHDELGQQLTVLKMDVMGLNKKLNHPDEAIKQKIGDIINLLDTTVRSVRRISSELRPSLLHNLGLVAAMEWHLKEFEKRSGIKIIFDEHREELKIPDSIKNGLFRIFQESLTNISRHANATKVIVSLDQKDQQLILRIEDNGQGFEKEKITAKKTLGILGMRERCQMMGGDYEIRSAPGKGTTVIAAVPYHERDTTLNNDL
ncbi:MAG TPA: MEDS domain-containing protein [Puia sp.]